MKKLALCAALLAVGCTKSDADKPAAEQKKQADEVPSMTVDQVDKMIAANEGKAVDCNGDRLRKSMGVVPGAILLTDEDHFNARELPADKKTKLVFYCHDAH